MSGWSKKRLSLRLAEGFQFQGDYPIQEDYFELNPERGIFIFSGWFRGKSGSSSRRTYREVDQKLHGTRSRRFGCDSSF